MSTAKEVAVGLGVLALFMALMFTAVIISEKNGYDYKIEALEATRDCPECQLVILSQKVGS